MSLTLLFHPLSSYCQKALVALYELHVPFEKRLVDLSRTEERDALVALWPMGRFPVIRDAATGEVVAESSIIIEWLDERFGDGGTLLPRDAPARLTARARDRFFDIDVHTPMQKIVLDNLRPEDKRDRFGVDQARQQIETAYAFLESWLPERGAWALGDTFTMADCAAAPALYYASKVVPFGSRFPRSSAYFERLASRPSIARVLDEAKPYLAMFPG